MLHKVSISKPSTTNLQPQQLAVPRPPNQQQQIPVMPLTAGQLASADPNANRPTPFLNNRPKLPGGGATIGEGAAAGGSHRS